MKFLTRCRGSSQEVVTERKIEDETRGDTKELAENRLDKTLQRHVARECCEGNGPFIASTLPIST